MKNTIPVRNTFSKEERLSSKKIMDEMFVSGQAFLIYPFKVTYKTFSPVVDFPVQIAFGVSKRYDKRAVYRNRIRRRMREAYRKIKSGLHEVCKIKNTGLYLFTSYVGKEELDYKTIESKFIKVIDRLIKQLNEESA